ncbi:MAG: macro domain-containing protein [Anaerolineales bacterium]
MNAVLAETRLPGGALLQLVQGDLTRESSDAIVNAANAYLHHGGGLAWAIVQRGGETIQRESDAWVREHGLVTHDSPAVTSGGALPCRYVIHAVGPVWGEGEEEAKLAAAVTGSLRRADELGLTSVSLPAISTGIFGFPKERAAEVTLAAIRDYFAARASHLSLIRLVLFDGETLQAFRAALNLFENSPSP